MWGYTALLTVWMMLEECKGCRSKIERMWRGWGGLVVLKRNTKLDKINISGIRFADMFYILFAYVPMCTCMVCV